MDLNFIRPDKPIAKGINCLTFTSSYFKQHNVDPVSYTHLTLPTKA